MVVGLEEPILIKGVGEIIAKIDSGNAGYNVIHGEDLTVQGDILTFKTQNKDGKDRRVSKKIKEKLNVNIGGGHIQERPVVELDVQIGGQEYKKILFSVTDRSSNDNKVLISADFIGKEMDALIDVTKKKIADDNIEVDYVTEGMDQTVEKRGFFKKASDGAKNLVSGAGQGTVNIGKSAANKAKNVVKGAGNALKGTAKALTNPLNSIKKLNKALPSGKNAMAWVTGDLEQAPDKEISKEDENELKDIAKIPKMMDEDVKNIKKNIAQFEKTSIGKVDSNAVSPAKIFDYAGNGPNPEDPEKSYPEGYKDQLKKALGAMKRLAKSSQSLLGKMGGDAEKAKGLKLENSFLDAVNILLEADAQPQPAQPNQPQGQARQPQGTVAQDSQNNDQDKKKGKEPETGTGESDATADVDSMNGAQLQAFVDDLKKRNKAIFYIVCVGKNKGDVIWSNCGKKIDAAVVEFTNAKKYDLAAFEQLPAKLVKPILSSDEDGNSVGLFALCTGPIGSRKCQFFTKPDQIFNGVKAKEEADGKMQEAVKSYNNFNKQFIDTCKKLNMEVGNNGLSETSWNKFCALTVSEIFASSIKVIKAALNVPQIKDSLRALGLTSDVIGQMDTENFKPEMLPSIKIEQIDNFIKKLSEKEQRTMYIR